jgi:hypothetical protein
MGIRRRPGNPIPQNQQFNEDLVGNEENEYLFPDLNGISINITNELSDALKNSLKEVIMDDITEKLMEKLQDMVN